MTSSWPTGPVSKVVTPIIVGLVLYAAGLATERFVGSAVDAERVARLEKASEKLADTAEKAAGERMQLGKDVAVIKVQVGSLVSMGERIERKIDKQETRKR